MNNRLQTYSKKTGANLVKTQRFKKLYSHVNGFLDWPIEQNKASQRETLPGEVSNQVLAQFAHK